MIEDMNVAPLISVIVPIYNVAPYLRKCLDSLKKQTMREIEVICIDDGSTDGSGEIADEYASDEFPIFRVIHTDNRGLSAARNRGIEEALADWIMFVDSDDWADEWFCEIPWRAKEEYGADLVIFRGCRVTGHGRIKRSKKINRFKGVVGREAAIDVGGAAAWNKLYRKGLFDDTRYPEGHVYEELATTHKLIYKATRIIKIPHFLYYYRYRRGSISNSSIYVDDHLSMSKQRYNDLIEYGYPREKAYAQLLESALRYCGKAQSEESSHYQEALNIVKEGSSVHLNNKAKKKKCLFCFNKNLYRFVYKLAIYAKDAV